MPKSDWENDNPGYLLVSAMAGESPKSIEFFFDFISPYAYIGSVAITRLAAKHGYVVDWNPVLIGVTILKIMGMQPLPTYPLKGPYLRRDRERLSEWFNVPLRQHPFKGHNSVVASRAFLVIKEYDPALARRFAQKAFERLWQEGLDISELDSVIEIADSIGIDRNIYIEDLSTSATKERLKEAVNAAVEKGVFGVPTFIADGEMFWGNDHIWMLEHWLLNHSFKPSDAS